MRSHRGPLTSAHNLISVLKADERHRPTFFGFYVGDGDSRFLAENLQLNRELNDAHVTHLFAVYSGGHTTRLWQAHARSGSGSRSRTSLTPPNAGLTAPLAERGVQRRPCSERPRRFPRTRPARCRRAGRVRRGRARRRLPLRRQLLDLSRLRAAQGSGLRPRRRASPTHFNAHERRARRPHASRSTSTCRPATRRARTGATRSSTSCTAFPAGRARFSRPSGSASSRTSSSRCTRSARDPRDAVRLDRARSPTRSGRTACGRTRTGRRSSRAISCARSTRATGRSRRGERARARGALGGRLRRAQHRPPPPRRVRRARELVRLRARRPDPLDLRHRPRRVLTRNSPSLTLGAGRGEAAPRSHVRLVLQRHRATTSSQQNTAFAAELRRYRIPLHYFVVHGGHNWGIWRGNAVARAARRCRGGSMARKARRAAGAARSSPSRRAGWLYLVQPGASRPARATRAAARRALAPCVGVAPLVRAGLGCRCVQRSVSTRAGRGSSG